jgi:hypothetical protein
MQLGCSFACSWKSPEISVYHRKHRRGLKRFQLIRAKLRSTDQLISIEKSFGYLFVSKNYLKLRNIHFKQIAIDCWAIPCHDILLKPFCFVSYTYLNLYNIFSFDMSCSLCCSYVFETCKVKSVLKLYFQTFVNSSNCFTFHFTKFLSHFLNKLMLNRNYFFN